MVEATVGNADGCKLGVALVGSIDGTALANAVGDSDGCAVGCVVGIGVGSVEDW